MEKGIGGRIVRRRTRSIPREKRRGSPRSSTEHRSVGLAGSPPRGISSLMACSSSTTPTCCTSSSPSSRNGDPTPLERLLLRSPSPTPAADLLQLRRPSLQHLLDINNGASSSWWCSAPGGWLTFRQGHHGSSPRPGPSLSIFVPAVAISLSNARC